MRSASRDDFATVPRDQLWLGALCMAAEACALIGSPRVRASGWRGVSGFTPKGDGSHPAAAAEYGLQRLTTSYI